MPSYRVTSPDGIDFPDALLTHRAPDYVVRYNAARTYALLGEPEAALDWLEQAFDSSAVWRPRLALWMKSDEDVDPLPDPPRFHALLQRLEAVLEPQQ